MRRGQGWPAPPMAPSLTTLTAHRHGPGHLFQLPGIGEEQEGGSCALLGLPVLPVACLHKPKLH